MVENPQVGMTVRDDLTREICRIVQIKTDDQGNIGVWLDSKSQACPDDDGGRFPWEISEV